MRTAYQKCMVRIACMLVLLALGVAGCASTTRTKAMASWNGANKDELVASWGAPDQVYEYSEGGSILTYRKQIIQMDILSICTMSFITDNVGRIRSWSFENCPEVPSPPQRK